MREANEDLEQSTTRYSWLKWGAIGLFVLWMCYGLVAYYAIQKPFTPEILTQLSQYTAVWLRFPFSVAALGRTLLDILAALWICWVALGCGLWVLRWLKIERESQLEWLLYALGLGFGVVGLLVLLLGMAGLLQTAVLVGLMLVLTLLTLKLNFDFVRQIRPSRPPRAITIFLAIIIGLALFVALLPPLDWDGLFYHLKGPKLYLEAGRIYGGVNIPHLSFPFLFEMLFMLAMGLRGDVAAKLLHFVFVFLLAGLVYVVARDQLKVKKSWLAVLFLFTMPMVLNLGTQAYNDLPLAFYQVAALLALFQWQRQRARGWLILSGLLCGLAMSMKYTSFVTPLMLAAFVAWDFRKDWRGAIRPLLWLAIPATLVFLPWLLKNFLFTGNPVYPFVFDGLYWDAYRAEAYAAPGTGIGWDLLALLRLPHDMMLGFNDASADGQMGPFFFIFLPLIVVYLLTKLGRGVERPYTQLLFFALAQYLFWMFGVIASAGLWQTRLMLPAFVALCPVLAWLLEDLAQFDHEQFSLRRFVGLVIVVALALNFVAQFLTWLTIAPQTYVLGSDSREEKLTRLLGPHFAAMQGINELPEDAVVAFLYEPRSYYCDRDCRPDSILDELGHLEYLYADAPAIAQAWQDEGITHVLVFDAGYEFAVESELESALPQNLQLLDVLRDDWLELVAQWDETYSLYALRP